VLAHFHNKKSKLCNYGFMQENLRNCTSNSVNGWFVGLEAKFEMWTIGERWRFSDSVSSECRGGGAMGRGEVAFSGEMAIE
jgi:hypothetical protein